MTDKVEDHWTNEAEAWDAIYGEDLEEGYLGEFERILTKLFRDSVFERGRVAHELVDPDPDTSVLDVGCGSGRVTLDFARSGATVVGIDIAEDMIQQARSNSDQLGVDSCTFVHSDFMQYEVTTSYDVALALGVFDYYPNRKAEQFLAKLCKNADRVLCTFPNLYTFQAPLRLVYRGAKGIRVYFRSRDTVAELVSREGWTYEIYRLPQNSLTSTLFLVDLKREVHRG